MTYILKINGWVYERDLRSLTGVINAARLAIQKEHAYIEDDFSYVNETRGCSLKLAKPYLK